MEKFSEGILLGRTATHRTLWARPFPGIERFQLHYRAVHHGRRRYSPTIIDLLLNCLWWCRKRDSNSRPEVYKTPALPAELLRLSPPFIDFTQTCQLSN